jgi:hypothetical protein
MEQIECSETSAYKIQTPGNYPEENIQHTEHGKSLKSSLNDVGEENFEKNMQTYKNAYWRIKMNQQIYIHLNM